MRYKPWGEVRYAWRTTSQTTTPAYSLTRSTFTGQYSHMDDPTTSGVTEGFGLMFYNARYYDPALGRFVSVDSLVPEQSQGVQAWDRFAYVSNNPVRYNDPSGHCILDGCWWATPVLIYGGLILFGVVMGESSRFQSAPTPVPSSTPTDTPNPTLAAVQTQIGPPNQLVIPTTPTASGPILKAAPTATQTITPSPTAPHLGDLVVESVSEQINNYTPYEPSFFGEYKATGYPPVDFVMEIGAAKTE